ncbi:MAG: FAD-dependent oxidoreductase [Clostridia bacterium]|nr:FAD-dependent oxidoreductase [Clostridia bacterium]
MIDYKAKIECKASYDVVVAGGGVSGIGAAIECARQGARVAIIERNGILGGGFTSGHVAPPLGSFTPNTMADELLKKVGVENGSGQSHDFEKMKIIISKMVADENIDVFYGCSLVDVVKKDKNITHLIFSTQSGLKAIEGKIFIDCTGDGVLSYLAGEKVEYGRDDGLVQPVSIMFTVENVHPDQHIVCYHEEMDTVLENGNYLALCREACKNGTLPPTVNIVRLYRGVVPTERMVNATQANGVNPLCPVQAGKAQALLREQMEQVVDFLKTTVKGFENIRIKNSTEGIGVRESRRVMGEYVMTAQDLLDGKKHHDVVVHNAAFCIDIHNPSGAGQSEQDGCPKQSQPYDVPYRALLPTVTDNLLVAGRCISGTHRAHASYRVMNICVNIGQATGIAGALCVKENVIPRKLDYKKIQKVLTDKGVELFN